MKIIIEIDVDEDTKMSIPGVLSKLEHRVRDHGLPIPPSVWLLDNARGHKVGTARMVSDQE